MDCAPRATKTSSNFPGVFHRFSRLCRLNSVGVSSSNENPKPTQDSAFEYCNTEEANGGDDTRDRKIHPQPLEEDFSEEGVLLRLFTAISGLKCAYMQLQQAHIPYEPKKIQVADELVISKFDSLSELEYLYIEKQSFKSKSHSSLGWKIKEYRELSQDLESQLQRKLSEISLLRSEVEGLDQKNAELEEKIMHKAPSEKGLFPLHRELTPSVFSDVFKFTSKAIHDFAKPLISLMKASGWNLDQAASSIDSSVIYAERSHKKFAFEAYLSRTMLCGSRDECFNFDQFYHTMSFRDPFDALMEDPDSEFARFCRSKYVMVVPSKMEELFFGHLDQRAFVSSGRHPRTPFYQAFVRMAKWVWALHVMANSFIPKAEIFYAKKGDAYSKDYMERVVDQVISAGRKLIVGLTVMPGFKIGSRVIRCRVYLCDMESSTTNFGFRW